MRSFFRNKFNDYLTNAANYRIKGGYDRKNNEYIVTFPSRETFSIDISGCTSDFDIEGAYVDSGSVYFPGNIVIGNPEYVTYDNEPETWDNICPVWNKWGYFIVDLSQLAATGNILVPQDEVLLRPRPPRS